MFEEKTQDVILQAMLDNAAAMSDVDLTEGSFTSNALSVAAMAIEDAYQDAETVMANALPDSCDREHLIRFAEARGMEPYPASAARYGVTCNVELPVGFRLTNGLLNFTVTEAGTSAVIQCDTAGAEGNAPTIGEPLDAVDYIDGFESCVITSIVARGTDEESTEDFRARYLAAIDVSGQGGNETYYREIVESIDGVGQVGVTGDDDGVVHVGFLAEGDGWPTSQQKEEVALALLRARTIGHTIQTHDLENNRQMLGLTVFYITPAAENTEANQAKIRQAVEEYLFKFRENFETTRELIQARLDAYVMTKLEEAGIGITYFRIATQSTMFRNLTFEPFVIPDIGSISYNSAT